jgi:hypothetical protein
VVSNLKKFRLKYEIFRKDWYDGDHWWVSKLSLWTNI